MKKLFGLTFIALLFVSCMAQEKPALQRYEKPEEKFWVYGTYDAPGEEFIYDLVIKEELKEYEVKEIYKLLRGDKDHKVIVINFVLEGYNGLWLKITADAGVITYDWNDFHDYDALNLSNPGPALSGMWMEEKYDETYYYKIQQKEDFYELLRIHEGIEYSVTTFDYEDGKFLRNDLGEGVSFNYYYIINQDFELCYYWDYTLLEKYELAQ